jgi:predicted O-methyltransferase YrrM
MASDDPRLAAFETFCKTLGKDYLADYQFMLQAYDVAERYGLSILPVSYYSPVATAAEIDAADDSELFGAEFGIDLDRAVQYRTVLEQVLPFTAELRGIPEKDAPEGLFAWKNGMFPVQDACTYYGMVRFHKPGQVLEVGSGFSTLIAARAAAKNGNTAVRCIEPYPTDFHNKHLRAQVGFSLIEKKVQDVPLEVFSELNAGDIFFIDSSHIVRPGSDLEYLVFRVLPVLKAGVIVHIHDMFIPKGYSKPYYAACKWHFNENYLIAALLADNPKWEVLMANAYLGEVSLMLDVLTRGVCQNEDEFKLLRGSAGGSSLWLRKRL